MSQPISLQQILNLTGIPPASIAFTTISLSSHTICVRDQSQVHLLGLNGSKQSKAITAQSCLIHPTQLILALRNDNICQVVDLDKKEKVASTTLDVQYWEYVNEDIACVTTTVVYMWNKDLVKVFEKQPQLQNCQYISFKRNASKKWMCLVGLNASDGTIKGVMQLYNTDKNVSQVIEGFCCTFTQLGQWDLFAFVTKINNALKVHVIEIDHTDGPLFGKKQVDVPISDPNDFPIGCQALNGLLYVFSKMGQFYLIDIETAQLLYINSMSGGTVFSTLLLNDGVLGVNRSGQVLKVQLNEDQCINYILEKFGPDLALSIAKRCNLPGAEDLYVKKYQQLLQQSNFLEAAKHAALSPKGLLRTPATINQLRNLTSPNGNPLLTYFGTLLESQTQLNQMESIELCQRILAQSKKQLLEKWLKEDLLTCTEQLGDLVHQQDSLLALSIYLRCNSSDKAILCFAETGQFDKIILYCRKLNITPNYQMLLSQVVKVDPDKAAQFAKQLANDPDIHLAVEPIVDVFMSANLFQQATAFMLEALKDDSANDGPLQTKLLEMNLIHAPQVADAILGNDMFHYYDKQYIASLCDKAGLYQRALEHYDDIADIKRVLLHAPLGSEWVINYFGRLSVEQSLECLTSMITVKSQLQLVVQIATRYHDQLNASNLIKLFEDAKSFEGLYYFLSGIVNFTTDKLVVYKYIQAACKIQQYKEVERICKESNYYDPERVVMLLKECKLPDQLALVIVCDRFDLIHDLILYLYSNQQYKTIELYCTKVNQQRIPLVIGALLDVDCDEAFIKQLLNIPADYPINQLSSELEKRNRLKLMLVLLENKVKNNSQSEDVHNALAKIYIDINNNPDQFLMQNKFYNPLLIGQYCEQRDPLLALIAYEQGKCDLEYIKVAHDNQMYKHLARYLCNRKDAELWNHSLQMENKQLLINQVVSVALPETTNSDVVSTCVKAFMANDLQHELVELLDKLIMTTDGIFSNNKNLQNLLLLTAIKEENKDGRILNYILKLTNYDAPDVAQLCIDHQLYLEAFTIYNKYDQHVQAIQTLVLYDYNKALDYAASNDIKECWSIMGNYQLNEVMIKEAIQSYIKANDPTNYEQMIELGTSSGYYKELISYHKMALNHAHSIDITAIQSSLIYCYSKCSMLSELQELLSNITNTAMTSSVGDLLFNEKCYDACKLIFQSTSNYSKLATTLVYLEEYQTAVECARKANNIESYKQVTYACIKVKEYRLAQTCALQVVVHADELKEMMNYYISNDCISELILLLQTSLSLERAHMLLFTELAILYIKYSPNELMNHLQLFYSRINIPTLIKHVVEYQLYNELVFLCIHYEDYETAISTMISHPSSFDHVSMKQCATHVNPLKAIKYYLEYHPELLQDFLSASLSTSNTVIESIISLFQQSDNLPLIKDYLQQLQKMNIKCINDALNEIYIEEEAYDMLTLSINGFSEYTNIAHQLANHELIEFRRISSLLYIKNKKYNKAIELYLQNGQHRDAIMAANMSMDEVVVNDLLQYFVNKDRRDCFGATLYVCYSYIIMDNVMEMSWRKQWNHISMPYIMQIMRDQMTRIKQLEMDSKKEPEPEVKVPLMIGYTGYQQQQNTGYQQQQNTGYQQQQNTGYQQQQNTGYQQQQPGYGQGFYKQ